MPELPEVETVRRGLAQVMEGRVLTHVVVNRGDLRWPLPADFAKRITGHTVQALGRRAKYLTLDLSSGDILLAHLGMSGRMVIDPPGTTPVEPGLYHRNLEANGLHEHVAFQVDGRTWIRFSDPRRFGMMDLVPRADFAKHRLIAGLGPEPTDDAFDGAVLAKRLKGKRTPIKAALLDQRVVAGLGNIYVCESLYHAGVSPRRVAARVQGERADRLVVAIKRVLAEAIEAGGSSLRDHRQASGELGYFQHRFAVYDREGMKCPDCTCDRTIRRVMQSARSTFYCAMRQR
jgi:formamidopyrimidine-DNA glycosylase